MIDILARALHTAGIDLTAEDLADVLWLLARGAAEPGQGAPVADPHRDKREVRDTGAPGTAHELFAEAPSAESPDPGSAAIPLYPLGTWGSGTRPSTAATRIGLRQRGAVEDILGVARALRPFKRVTDPGPSVLDVEATVEATADAHALVLVSRPQPQHRLDVALVVDATPSVALWAEMFEELEEILEQVGAFHSISRWDLVTSDVSPSDEETPGATTLPTESVWVRDTNGRLQYADRLIDPSGRRIVLLATDVVGSRWYGRACWEVLERWARVMPTTIIQVLPEHYWPDTALGDETVAVRAPWPASPNSDFDIVVPWWSSTSDHARLAIPVVALDPDSLARWTAAVVVGTEWTIAAPTTIRPDPPSVANVKVSDADRVRAFQARASREAQRLAEVFAGAPLLSMQLMRILQASLMPHTGVHELAEVLIGGLLEPELSPARESVSITSGINLRFRPGVAEILRQGTTISQEWQAYDALTKHLKAVETSGVGRLDALVPDPAGEAYLDPELRPLGALLGHLATRLGLTTSSATPVRGATPRGQVEESRNSPAPSRQNERLVAAADRTTEPKSFSELQLSELAMVYHRPLSATSLLTRAGIDRESHPSWDTSSTSQDFWWAVGELVASGWGGSDTTDRILATAGKDYPGNDVFRHPSRSSQGAASVTGTSVGGGRASLAFGSSGASGSPAPLSILGTIVVVDAVGFSKNGALLHLEWRRGISTLTAQAAAAAGIPAELMHFNDRGDGFMMIVDGRIPAETVVADFTRELRIALGRYNRTRNSAGRIRLRIAVHEGRAFVDGTGLAGTPAINTARLVDADELREVLRKSDALDTALIVSDAIYQSTVTERLRGLDPDDFVRVEVKTEKYTGVAWIAERENADAARAAGSGEETRPMAVEHLSVPEAATGRWDFLISCTDADEDWGQWIAHQLQTAKYKVHLDVFDMVAGTGRVAEWHDAVRYSTRTIAVLSESYLTAAREIQAQWQAAWESDGTGAGNPAGDGGGKGREGGVERRLIPVVVRPCQPDGLLKGITPIDLTSLRDDRNAARDHLLEEVAASLSGRRKRSEDAAAFPGEA